MPAYSPLSFDPDAPDAAETPRPQHPCAVTLPELLAWLASHPRDITAAERRANIAANLKAQNKFGFSDAIA